MLVYIFRLHRHVVSARKTSPRNINIIAPALRERMYCPVTHEGAHSSGRVIPPCWSPLLPTYSRWYPPTSPLMPTLPSIPYLPSSRFWTTFARCLQLRRWPFSGRSACRRWREISATLSKALTSPSCKGELVKPTNFSMSLSRLPSASSLVTASSPWTTS